MDIDKFFGNIYIVNMNKLDEIREKIKNGTPYEELSKQYPLTINGYKKLGGVIKKKRKVNSHSVAAVYGKKLNDGLNSIDIIVEDEQNGIEKKLNRSHIIGTLLGDASIVVTTNKSYRRTFYYTVAHTWRQIEYTKLNYEKLKPYVSRVTISEPRDCDGFKDYCIYINTESTSDFLEYYDMFYTHLKRNCNPKKHVFRSNIATEIDAEALSFWLMDDGNQRGKAKGVFELTIGMQDFYTEREVKCFVDILTDKIGIPFYYNFGSTSIEIYNKIESSEKAIQLLSPYIIPDLSYKLGLEPDMCGSIYSGEIWYKNWQKSRINIQHPFLEDNDIDDYRRSKDPKFKEMFRRALLYRTKVRGFPYASYSNSELLDLWNNLKESSYECVEAYLKPNYNLNRFPSYFFPNRFRCIKKGHKSAVEVFNNNKDLSEVIARQLKSKDNINNSNIRNAIGGYGAPVPAQFNPAYARYFIAKYSNEGDLILDPSAGWGSRLASSISLNRSYYGIEPNSETVTNLNKEISWFKNNNIDVNATIVKGCSEDIESYRGIKFDMAITSPPFFDKEVYSYEDTQSIRRYSDFEEWCEKFLKIMILNTFNSLKKGKVFVLNVANYSDCHLAYISKYLLKDVGYSIKDIVYTKPVSRPVSGKSLKEEFIVARKI